MQGHNTLKSTVLLFVLLLVFAGCKKEKAYNPGIPQGTRFPHITFNGFALDSLQVRVGPRSNTAGYVFEGISESKFEIPFDTAQTVSRIVMYNKDGSLPYTGSQIRFENKYRDTSVNVLYDGKTVVYNPIMPKPSAGKMGLRINFKSIASKYTGPVDIEIHEKYISGESVVIKREAQVIRNVKRTEFSPYVEINAPTSGENFVEYIFYIRIANTQTPLNYPANVAVTEYDVLPFQPDYTALLTIIDIRLELETPNRIIYGIEDRALMFPQEQ